MRPPATVKPTTANGRSSGPTTKPAPPLTRAGRASGANAAPRARTCARDRLATADRRARARAARPRRCGRRRPGRAPRAAPRSRPRAQRRGTRPRPRAAARGRRRRSGAAPRTRRRARLASCRAAVGRAVDDLGDLVERHAEHVVQHEGEPLGRRQRLEHDEQREADRVGEQRLLLGVGLVVDAHDRLGQPAADVVLAPRAPRAQHVEAHAPDDRREPAAEVRHGRRVGAAQAQPRLLHRVLGLADRAEHPVGDRPQVRPVRLELLRPASSRSSTSHPSVGIRHRIDESDAADVTAAHDGSARMYDHPAIEASDLRKTLRRRRRSGQGHRLRGRPR